MIDFLPLIGIVIITLGLALKLNTLLVILTAGAVTGFIADMSIIDILSAIGQAFTQNRYMSIFILILPMIGMLERFGLRQRAETLISSIKKASVTKILMTYLLLRKVTNAFGLHIGGHPSMIRPLISPMCEATAENQHTGLISEEKRQRIRALAAASENIANFFSQLAFIGASGLLLIKGVMSDNQIEVQLETMAIWAIPTALAAFVLFFLCSKFLEASLKEDSATFTTSAKES